MSTRTVGTINVSNLGFTERLALHWVQQYIHAFGGDPSKVTMYVKWPLTVTRILLTSFSWGQSAGSVSVSLQMVTNGGNTERLFRAAFMQSGSPIPTSDITDVSVPMHTVILPNC